MRTTKEDIELLGRAGVWDGDRDPLMNAVILLCMYAKRRHKPVRNVHLLAKAVESDDATAAQKYYSRLAQEVSMTLRKYPDIQGTLETTSQMTDEDLERIDRVMREY